MYKMCEDCVLVLPMPNSDSKTEAGIIVPGQVRNRPIIGTVLAVGPGLKMDDGGRFKETLKVGSEVVFPAKSGDAIYLDGHDYIIIPSRYILMIISEPDEEEEKSDENRAAMELYKDGDCVCIDSKGDIIPKEEKE